MNRGFVEIASAIIEIYNSVLLKFPPLVQKFIELFLLVILIVFYSWFIWKLCKFISRKNILELNLNKYNKSEHPFFEKIFAGILYFVEYILILPFLIFFWFVVFTFFLILITEGFEVNGILVISAIIISAIRMTAYYKEELSRDLAKMLPFTLLAVAITKPGFFNMNQIFTHFSKIPSAFGVILSYLLFIILLEIILRFFDFIISLLRLE